MLAKIQGVFRLTRDAELRYSQSGSGILNLGLACSEKYKDKEKQLFLDATVFGKGGELINQYSGRKGNQIFLTGKLELQQWVDQQNNKRSKICFIVEDFEFLNNNKNDNQQSQHGRYDEPQHQQAQSRTYDNKPDTSSQQQMPSSNSVPVIDIEESEIPF